MQAINRKEHKDLPLVPVYATSVFLKATESPCNKHLFVLPREMGSTSPHLIADAINPNAAPEMI